MISVLINTVNVYPNNLVFTNNRKASLNVGSMNFTNTRADRYEPYSLVEINNGAKYYQYLVETDTPLRLNQNLWEHSITLVEPIAILSTLFPVDRSFTTAIPKTINEILAIYKKELSFYHDFILEYDETDTIYNEKMVEKEYSSTDMAVIVYDLFRKINAIPRLLYDNGVWYLSYELYTKKNNEITFQAESQQTNVNDVDYATEAINKTRNSINEAQPIYFPSRNTYVSPRSQSTMLQTSDLQYELDSNINALYKVEVFYFGTYTKLVGGEIVFDTAALNIDITNGIKTKEEYDTLEVADGNNITEKLLENQETRYKQNSIYYEIGKNTINGLYWKKDGVIFDQNIYALVNLTNSYLNAAARRTLGDGDENYIEDSFFVLTDDYVDNLECRFYYQPKRNVDFITEKQYTNNYYKTTILNNQKDSSIEVSRQLESSQAYISRLGTPILTITKLFNLDDNYWEVGDYFSDWLCIDIRYSVKKTKIECQADFAEGFSNIEREAGISREPSPYVYTGEKVQSNFIVRKYLVFNPQNSYQEDNETFTAITKRTVMNLFDYSNTYNTPLSNGIFYKGGKYINTTLFVAGGGNSIIMQMAFKDVSIAGNALKKIGSAWYKDPIYYVDDEERTLENAIVTLTYDINRLTDTSTYKYYPLIDYTPEIYTKIFNLPIDKNIDDTLAITFELIAKSEDNNVIIPNGFARLNNLITFYETTPDLKLYSRNTSYSIFDKYVQTSDNEITGDITLTTSNITVYDNLMQPIEFWGLAIGNEYILCGNNNTYSIDYIFTERTQYASYNDIEIATSFEGGITINILSNLTQQLNYEDLVSGDIQINLLSNLTQIFDEKIESQTNGDIEINVLSNLVQILEENIESQTTGNIEINILSNLTQILEPSYSSQTNGNIEIRIISNLTKEVLPVYSSATNGDIEINITSSLTKI